MPNMPQLLTFYIAAQIIERITEVISRIGDKDKKLEKECKFRARWLWAVSSVLGVILAFALKLGFFSQAGQAIDPMLDQFLSGIALGSGTKPVHDILAYMQKASAEKGG